MSDYDIRLDEKYGQPTLIDVGAEATAATPWLNQTLTSVNDTVVRLGVLEGEYRPASPSSGLLPPSPALPGSGCPQLHRAAATTRRRSPFNTARFWRLVAHNAAVTRMSSSLASA